MRREEWIYGSNPVLEALRAGRNIRTVYLCSGRHEKVKVEEIRREAEIRGVQVEAADHPFFDSRFPKGHQGVAARAFQKEYLSIEELISGVSGAKGAPLLVILDGIEDPRNLGAIMRSVDAAGGHGIVIQSHRSASPGPEASKASAGAVEHVAVSVVSNIKHAMRQMKESGITVIGAESGDYPAIWDVDLTVPLAVIIGSEGRGMRKTVRENCDMIVTIPMKGKINSLNASVAAGILLFEILRQRYRNR
jgi:23S rRNA (guanosine2251-2'-O)-methyltransferase